MCIAAANFIQSYHKPCIIRRKGRKGKKGEKGGKGERIKPQLILILVIK